MSYLELARQVEARLVAGLSGNAINAKNAESQVKVGRAGEHPPSPVALCTGAPGFSDSVSRLLDLPLDRFADAGTVLQVAVPWYARPLWFCPDPAAAEALIVAGLARPGETWTATELIQVISIPGVTPERARTIALVRVEFQADVVAVHPARPEAPGGSPDPRSGPLDGVR